MSLDAPIPSLFQAWQLAHNVATFGDEQPFLEFWKKSQQSNRHEMLQMSDVKGDDFKGISTLWWLSFAAVLGHRAALTEVLPLISTLDAAARFNLLQTTAQGQNEGASILLLLIQSANNNFPDLFLLLLNWLGDFDDTQLLAAIQAKAKIEIGTPIGGEKREGATVLWWLFYVASQQERLDPKFKLFLQRLIILAEKDPETLRELLLHSEILKGGAFTESAQELISGVSRKHVDMVDIVFELVTKVKPKPRLDFLTLSEEQRSPRAIDMLLRQSSTPARTSTPPVDCPSPHKSPRIYKPESSEAMLKRFAYLRGRASSFCSTGSDPSTVTSEDTQLKKNSGPTGGSFVKK